MESGRLSSNRVSEITQVYAGRRNGWIQTWIDCRFGI